MLPVLNLYHWNLGPVNDITGEGLVTSAYANKPGFTNVQDFFGSIEPTPTPTITSATLGSVNAPIIINNAQVFIVN